MAPAFKPNLETHRFSRVRDSAMRRAFVCRAKRRWPDFPLNALKSQDFASKNSIALKEARETYYWLDLLNDAGYLPKTDSTQTLLADCNELIAMLVSTVKTAKKT
jgi:hypothetical protein